VISLPHVWCGWDIAESGWDLAELWMRSSRIVMASDSQCWSRNCPGFYLSILWHSLTWGAPDEAVFNKVRREKNRPLHVWWCSLLNCEWKDGAGMRWWAWEWPPPLCRPRVLSVDTGWATHQLFSSPSWTLQVRIMNIHMKMSEFWIRIQICSHFEGWIRIRNENADQGPQMQNCVKGRAVSVSRNL
jgi:hypothetical protein